MGYLQCRLGGCSDTLRSMIVKCFFLGDSHICQKSNKQTIVARSSSSPNIVHLFVAFASCNGLAISRMIFILAFGCRLSRCLREAGSSFGGLKYIECVLTFAYKKKLWPHQITPSSFHQLNSKPVHQTLLPQLFHYLIPKPNMVDIYQSSACRRYYQIVPQAHSKRVRR